MNSLSADIVLKKEQIVKVAANLQVPLENTWSCYESNTKVCRVCDSCRLRAKGFKLAGLIDPII